MPRRFASAMSFFFFQAEDGIRDWSVTGVQTCALPISIPVARASGLVLVATTVLALQTALGLVFDPRYRDFTDAELSAAGVPFAIATALVAGRAGPRRRPETIAAATLAGAAV